MNPRPMLAAAALAAATLTSSQANAAGPAVVTVGTSIEAGTWLQPGESWPSRLAQRAPSFTFSDASLPGGAYTRPNEVGDTIRKHVDQAAASSPDTMILGGPVNDLVSLDSTQIGELDWAVFGAVNDAHAAGVRHVIVMAILPFNDGRAFPAGWWATLEERRGQYNTWCQQMYGPDCVGLDWALHETTTYRGDNRWYLDGLHLSRVGAALVAEAFPKERLG